MEQHFEAFHNAIIIDKKESNTCKKVEKREEKDGGGERRKQGWWVQLGNGVSETDGKGRRENSPTHYENTTKLETPGVNGTKRTSSSHPEAAACQQTPTNEWNSLNERHRNVDGSGMASSALPSGHGEFLCNTGIGWIQKLITSDGLEMEAVDF